jgi:hypothetical protein
MSDDLNKEFLEGLSDRATASLPWDADLFRQAEKEPPSHLIPGRDQRV